MATRDDSNENLDLTPSKSSDLNNSLVKKVTSLIPTSISKWFGKNKPATRRRDSDSSEDESIIIEQPPIKRARIPTDYTASSSNYSNGPLYMNSRAQENPTEFLSNIRSRLRYSNYNCTYDSNARGSESQEPEPNANHSTVTSQQKYVADIKSKSSVLVNGEKKTDSGGSTSGCSSMAQRNANTCNLNDEHRRTESPTPNSDSVSNLSSILMSSKRKKTDSDCNNSTMVNQSTRSLFTDHFTSSRPTVPSLASRRPSFNTSTFGSPNLVDHTLTTERVTNSPFYQGHTMFGGASAYRKGRQLSGSNTATPVRNSIQIKPANESVMNNNSASLSQTARRILDILEHFSSPINDARKIPRQNLSSKKLAEESQRSALSRTPYSRDASRIKELHIPTVADLIQLRRRERLQDSTVKTRQIATTSNSELNKEVEYKLRTEEDNMKQKHSNKMKTKISKVREKSAPESPVAELNLCNVALPITTLPTFDIALPQLPTLTTLSAKTTARATTTTTTLSSQPPPTVIHSTDPVSQTQINSLPKPQTNDITFKFAPPITLSKGNCLVSINNFKFSKPIIVSDGDMFTFKSPSYDSPVLKRKSIKINGDIDMFKPAPTLKSTGSVMDILGKNNSNSSLDKFKSSSETWECATCLIRNKPDNQKCVACLAAKPTTTPKLNPTKPLNVNSAFGQQYKMSGDKWECTVCMVRNNNADTRCVACTTARPGGIKPQPQPQVLSPKIVGFGDKFKPSSDTWECSTCMVRNKSDIQKCIACETSRSSTLSAATPLASTLNKTSTSSNFPESFTKKTSEWECPSCMVRNPNQKMKCACCEAPQPGASIPSITSQANKGIILPTSTPFKFGIDKANIKTPTNVVTSSTFTFGVKSPTTTAPTSSGFKFGVPNSTSETTTTGFVFGIPNTKTDEKDEHKRSDETDTAKKQLISHTTTNTKKETVPQISFATQNEKTNSEIKSSPLKSIPTFNFSPPVTTIGAIVTSTSTTTTTSPTNKLFTFGSPKLVNSPSTIPSITTQAVSSSTISLTNNSVIPTSTTQITSDPSSKESKNKESIFGDSNKSLKASTLAFGQNGANNPIFGGVSTNNTGSISFDVSSTAGVGIVNFGLVKTETTNPQPQSLPLIPPTTTVSVTTATHNIPSFSTTKPVEFGVNFGAVSSSTNTTPSFGSVSATTKSSGFGSFADTAIKAPPDFNNVTSVAKPSLTFGAATSTPVFGLTNTASTATPIFATTTVSSFSSNTNTPSFGTANNSTPSFANATPFQTNQNSSFGSLNKEQSWKGGFVFGNNTFEEKPTTPFSFSGNSENTAAATNKLPSFSFTPNSNFEFGAKSVPTPATGGFNFNVGATKTVAPPSFGAGSASNNVFNNLPQTTTASPAFGAPAPVFGTAAASTPAAFSFGAAATQPPAMFSFGASATQGPSGQTGTPGGFTFGGTSQQPAVSVATTASAPPTFNPNTKPMFNFSGGAAPTAFTAQATPGTSAASSNPQRRIKKAVRRTRGIP